MPDSVLATLNSVELYGTECQMPGHRKNIYVKNQKTHTAAEVGTMKVVRTSELQRLWKPKKPGSRCRLEPGLLIGLRSDICPGPNAERHKHVMHVVQQLYP